MKPGKTTMADVAERAGVSPATVARVLYANGYVSKQRRAIVEAALKATGYRPNVMARALRTARSFTLGMVVSESRLNPFHSLVAHAVQLEALQHGYTVLTLNNGANEAIEREGVQRFLDQHVDAIIFCAAINAETVRSIAASGTPVVQVERQRAKVGSFSLVDPKPGIKQAIEHLRDLGHARIGYIGGEISPGLLESPRVRSVEAQRVDAFRNSLTAAGLAVAEELTRLVPYYVEGVERHPAGTMTNDLLSLARRPTAIVYGADVLAAPGLQALAENGMRVPADISIISYDDTFAEILTPPLTSIAQPISELGRNAVTLALGAIANSDAPPRKLLAGTKLVLRQSTGSPAV